MNVLLLSMPDSFEHMPPVAIRMPNGALTSLAGNVDPHHRVAVADLMLVQDRVRETVERLVREHAARRGRPLVMTFQRTTALRLIARGPRAAARGARSSSAATIRASRPRPTTTRAGVDFIVRGEGEITFRELLRALEARRAASTASPASPTATATGFRHNPDAAGQRAWRPRSCGCRGATPACSTATRCSAGRST